MPTALELTREGWQHYLEGARHRQILPQLTPEDQRERERVLDRVRNAAAALKSRFGARRVVLLGSLAHGAWFTSHSDVDIAVEGLSGDDYWSAWRMVEEIIGDRSVDFIDIETAGVSLLQTIDRCGLEL